MKSENVEGKTVGLFAKLLAESRRRLLGESIPRLRKCMDQLTVEELWYRPNENSNSVGNLVLHLCGNVRQWLIAALGRQPDVRQRQQEFDERGPLPHAHLHELLDQLEKDIEKTLNQLTPSDLEQSYSVQGFAENGVSILVHVVEHFSYHVGQCTYFVKAHKDMDMAYYGENLDITNG